MAIIHMAANIEHIEAEAHVVHETNEKSAWYKQDAKKRRWILLIHSLLILISICLVLYVLLWPGVLGNILVTVKETLNRWRDRMSDYILMPESAEQPANSFGMIWLGILLALDWLLRTVGKALLFVLAWTAPVWLVGGMIWIAFLIVRYSCGTIADNWWHKPKKKEIKDSVIQSLSKEMAKDYDESQGERCALASLEALSDQCHIFTNLDITYNGESCKSDMVVVSPSGVTVVEVNSDSGLLFGDLSENNLVRWKYLDTKVYKGEKYSKEKVQNPVKELGAQVHQLAHYLRDRGVSVYVQSCVLFADEKVQLHVTDYKGLAKNCPLFLINAPELLDYLHSAEHATFTSAMIQQIVEALNTQNFIMVP